VIRMTFFSFVVRNIARQRMRTILTVVGIAVGITTVVALGAVAGGLRATAGAMLKTGDADFIVAQKGSADLTFSALSLKEWKAVESRPDVERATGLLMNVSKIGSNPYFALLGVKPEQLALAPPPLVRGRSLAAGRPGEIMLGRRAAADLGADVGQTVELLDQRFTVVGVFRGDMPLFDGGAYAPLDEVQHLTHKEGLVTALYVKVKEGADPRTVATAIEAASDAVTTVSSVDEYGKVDQGVEAIDAANLAISLLAVLIGAVGVTNTMIMSVFERTREIGILRAVGWRSSRIMRMIVGESLLLCLLAAVVGIALGILATRALLLVPAIETFLEPQYTPGLFLKAFLVGVGVGIAGALYPAARAVRLSPMEALRHE
jgi:putative ABC transport system permease protein